MLSQESGSAAEEYVLARTVSAIIPVRNAKDSVAASVRSVLAQRHDLQRVHARLECIVVDDGSTDGTDEVLRTFGDQIRLIRQPFSGPSAARNAGVAASTGSLLAFLDADDVWLPGKLCGQIDVVDRVPGCGLVYTGFRVPRRLLRPSYSVFASDPASTIRSAVLLRAPGLASSSTALIVREAFEGIGGYDESLRVCEDIDLVRRIAARYTVAAIPQVFVECCLHAPRDPDRLQRLEIDGRVMLAGAVNDGLHVTPRIADACLHSYLAWRHIFRGRAAEGFRHVGKAWARRPMELVSLPATALAQRVATLIFRRWPLRVPEDLDLTDSVGKA